MKTLLTTLLIMALLLAAAPAGADTFLVLGRAPLGGNEAAAKEAAVTDAQFRAVAQAAASSLDPATLRGNLAVLNQEVLADAKRYINNYTLVASAPSGEFFLALVSVTIDQRALTHALIRAALKLPTSHMGTVLVMVSEETAPGRPPVYWWSGLPGAPDSPAPLTKVIKSMGIRIVNPQPLKALLTPDMHQPVLSEAQALEFARQAGAQVVLLGSIRTYPLVTPKMVIPPPLVQLLAIDTRSGQVMAIEETEGPNYHTTPAAEEYSKLLAQVEFSVRNLMAKLSARLAEATPVSRKLTLKVSGVRSLGQLMRLEKTMLGMDDLVESLQRVSAGAGRATFTLTLKGPASSLADQLMVKQYGDFLVNVVEQSKKAMEVVIIPRQPGTPMLRPAPGQGAPAAKPKTGDEPFPWEQQKGQAPAQKQGQPQQQQESQPAQPGAPSDQKFPWEQPKAKPAAQPAAQPAAKPAQESKPAQPAAPSDQKMEQNAPSGTGQGSGSGKVTFPWEQGQ
ncbi:MAG: hypothetical protein K9K66_02715 [Desulfarculaceae bacterium]|nr:hypothetical protein [Desulfarculaceae bacterium]MCF8070960.1 hypothetical protein [Desulfarculaceae bacterium]MCF8100548.1 hypothetical protein [Desulfarculaceae bacterium]MCF8116574.1 hypothetical protein [Desulfarculaceae bacterium]